MFYLNPFIEKTRKTKVINTKRVVEIKLGIKSMPIKGSVIKLNFKYVLLVSSFMNSIAYKKSITTDMAINMIMTELICYALLFLNQTPLIRQIFSANETSFNTSNLGNWYFFFIFSAVR